VSWEFKRRYLNLEHVKFGKMNLQKLIYIIFLPMILSENDQTLESIQTIEVSDSQPLHLGPSNLESVFLMFKSTNVTCPCEGKTHGIKKREDYQYTPGIGYHKHHVLGMTFNDARKICYEEGGHLAIINSLREEQ
ncbi:hypothetical protein KQX54_015145, partial [Cotesia glomerata]